MTAKSDIQSFEPGDVLVGATVLNNPDDDHAGDGRIIQYDNNLVQKGELWIDATTHLIAGLKFDSDGVLWAFEDHNTIRISPTGEFLEVRNIDDRMFSNVNFVSDGTLILGEHANEVDIPDGMFKTELVRMPDGRLGDGNAYRYSRDGQLLDTFEAKIARSMGKFLAVTCAVLSPDETRLIYVTETGNLVMQYDLINHRQLDDLMVLDGEDMMQNMVFWLAYTPDGRLLVCRGDHIQVIDDDTGEPGERYELGPFGFAAIAASPDNRHVYGSSFLSGEIVKIDMNAGETVARADVGVQRSTAGIAEYPG
jgi:sugar lactone lactonase YvrE